MVRMGSPRNSPVLSPCPTIRPPVAEDWSVIGVRDRDLSSGEPRWTRCMQDRAAVSDPYDRSGDVAGSRVPST
jgi:hypothetical protein